MSFDPLGFDRDLLVTIAAVLAVVCGILAAGWPYLVRDDQEERMRRVVQSSTRPRLTDPALSTEGRRRTLLRSEPSKILSAIVERFNLARKLEGGATLQLLRSAGFRGRAPVITFLAMRVLMPVIVFGVASFYIFVVIKPDLPLLAELGIAVVLSGLGYYLPTVYVKNRITKRQKSIRRSWPDALDLLLICVESGMSSEHAFRKVADEIGDQSRELAEELSLTTAELGSICQYSLWPPCATTLRAMLHSPALIGWKGTFTGVYAVDGSSSASTISATFTVSAVHAPVAAVTTARTVISAFGF